MDSFFYGIVYIFCRIIHLRISQEKIISSIQFFKFCLIGITNTLLSYFIYVIVVYSFKKVDIQCKWDFVAGNVIAWLLSVLWSFYWNERFVFGRNINIAARLKALLKTYASYAFSGLVLGNVILWLLISQLGISKYIAPFFKLLTTIPLNFILNKFWAFRGNQ